MIISKIAIVLISLAPVHTTFLLRLVYEIRTESNKVLVVISKPLRELDFVRLLYILKLYLKIFIKFKYIYLRIKLNYILFLNGIDQNKYWMYPIKKYWILYSISTLNASGVHYSNVQLINLWLSSILNFRSLFQIIIFIPIYVLSILAKTHWRNPNLKGSILKHARWFLKR